MSNIGFYRYRLSEDFLLDNKTKVISSDGSINKETKVNLYTDCYENKIIIKYLDRNGHYKFFVFNEFYEGKDSPQQIGEIEKLLLDIQTDQTDSKNVGYKNEKRISVSADVNIEQLYLLSDLFASPRVYMQYGSKFFTDQNTLFFEVTLRSNDNVYRKRKGTSSKVNFDILMPKNYEITML